jgi:predicted NBD/HSP70 family sugar kinase
VGFGGDQLALRRQNLGLVLRTVREQGPHVRARIAELTGLNKATVSSLVAELVDRGLLEEAGLERGGVGRPGQTVRLDGTGVCGIGAEINVNHLGTLAVDLAGAELSRHRLSVDCTRLAPAEVLDELAAVIRRTVDAAAARGAVPVGVTVGAAGLVDVDSGVLRLGPNLGWHDVPVGPALQARLAGPSYPLRVENEANLASSAEAVAVPSGEHGDVLVLVGEVGVGGGVVAGGRLLRGHSGFAGEIGHITVDPNGARCGCGRIGCWETVVGLHAVLRAAADPGDPLHDPAIGLDERLAELDRRAGLGDARTLAALDELGRWLAIGLATLVNVLNPAVIVLGGYFGVLGDRLIPTLRRELLGTAGNLPNLADCRLVRSTLGFEAAVHGGARAALEPVFDDPTLIERQSTAAAATAEAGGVR